MSRDLSSLVRAFIVYVRSISEYCSVVWNPFLLKDVTALEKVQRRFTKRLRGMNKLTYHQRLVKVGLESLELRRIRADLVLAYKIIFGLTDLNTEDISRYAPITPDVVTATNCTVYMPYSKSTARYNYFNHRVGRIWNALPCDEVDFSSLRRFPNSLTVQVLVRYCSLNFI